MLDIPAVLARLDVERRELVRDGEVMERTAKVTRLQIAGGELHTVISSSLSAATADAAIAQEIEHHRALGVEFEWKVFAHDEPADLKDRLAAAGFTIGPAEAVMVCEAAAIAANAPDASATDNRSTTESESSLADVSGSFRVLPVDSEKRLADFRRVAEEVFGKDYSLTTGELRRAMETGSTQHLAFVAYAVNKMAGGDETASGDRTETRDGEPAAIGRLYTHPQSWFGGFFGGGTRRMFRGRGAYRATVIARARRALELGAPYVFVDALPTSRPILEKMGFVKVTETWPCVWRPDGSGR